MVETACSVLMSLILSVTGILLVVLGRRMAKRRLPPNSWAGVRYEIALRSASGMSDVSDAPGTPGARARDEGAS